MSHILTALPSSQPHVAAVKTETKYRLQVAPSQHVKGVLQCIASLSKFSLCELISESAFLREIVSQIQIISDAGPHARAAPMSAPSATFAAPKPTRHPAWRHEQLTCVELALLGYPAQQVALGSSGSSRIPLPVHWAAEFRGIQAAEFHAAGALLRRGQTDSCLAYLLLLGRLCGRQILWMDDCKRARRLLWIGLPKSFQLHPKAL